MKYLKIYENNNWSNKKLEEHINTYEFIKGNIKDFIKIEFGEKDLEVSTIYDMWYTKNWINSTPKNGEYFGFNYIDTNGEDFSYTLTKKEYDNFIIFLNNPGLYKNSKKYNL